MKKLFKFLLWTLGSLIGLILVIVIITFLWVSVSRNRSAKRNIALAGPEVKTLTIDSLTFRDLNKNGSLDIYENTRCSTGERVNDLLSQMNLEEKAGLMFIPPVSVKKDGSISEKPSLNDAFSLLAGGTSRMLFGKHINHFNIFTGTDKKGMAIWYNNLQKLAERTRLGIPVTIASDPRNSFSNNPLASAFAGDFSMWPEPIGLAAIGDSLTTWKYGCRYQGFTAPCHRSCDRTTMG
jgi:beta-glucosidase